VKLRKMKSRTWAIGARLTITIVSAASIAVMCVAAFANVGNAQVYRPGRAAAAVDPAEAAAYKAFETEGSPEAKIELGESFEWRYPNSVYAKVVEGVLVTLYYEKKDWAKFYSSAHDALTMDPDNLPVLTLVGWTIPRQYKDGDPTMAARLDEAEEYDKHAIGLVAAMKKPKGVTEDQFKNAQDGLAWKAHSGLGITYFRRKNYSDSVKELQIAIQEESSEVDPADLYILGIDLQNLIRPSEAEDAFKKCAAIADNNTMQGACKQSADTAAKLAALRAAPTQ
jgi:tetratricopeptide (TPR) repeat protein